MAAGPTLELKASRSAESSLCVRERPLLLGFIAVGRRGGCGGVIADAVGSEWKPSSGTEGALGGESVRKQAVGKEPD